MLFTHKELHCDVVRCVTLNGVRLRSPRPSYIATSRWAVLSTAQNQQQPPSLTRAGGEKPLTCSFGFFTVPRGPIGNKIKNIFGLKIIATRRWAVLSTAQNQQQPPSLTQVEGEKPLTFSFGF